MRANHTPFTDVCSLISVEITKDQDGYDVNKETSREVFCSVAEGVSRSEFYDAYKAGIQLSATFEVFDLDYEKETELEYDGTRYSIIRTYPTGYGTIELSCSEVVR